MGAAVTVIEARDRVGGRASGQFATASRPSARRSGRRHDRRCAGRDPSLAGQLGLTLSGSLRDGFGYMRSAGPNHPPRIITCSAARAVGPAAKQVATLADGIDWPNAAGIPLSPPISPGNRWRNGWTMSVRIRPPRDGDRPPRFLSRRPGRAVTARPGRSFAESEQPGSGADVSNHGR